MERFSADYIRQQPEYRFLMCQNTGSVIETCVEDGEVKLKFGNHPANATSSKMARLPECSTGRRSSGMSRASSALSPSMICQLTSTHSESSKAIVSQPVNNVEKGVQKFYKTQLYTPETESVKVQNQTHLSHDAVDMQEMVEDNVGNQKKITENNPSQNSEKPDLVCPQTNQNRNGNGLSQTDRREQHTLQTKNESNCINEGDSIADKPVATGNELVTDGKQTADVGSQDSVVRYNENNQQSIDEEVKQIVPASLDSYDTNMRKNNAKDTESLKIDTLTKEYVPGKIIDDAKENMNQSADENRMKKNDSSVQSQQTEATTEQLSSGECVDKVDDTAKDRTINGLLGSAIAKEQGGQNIQCASQCGKKKRKTKHPGKASNKHQQTRMKGNKISTNQTINDKNHTPRKSKDLVTSTLRITSRGPRDYPQGMNTEAAEYPCPQQTGNPVSGPNIKNNTFDKFPVISFQTDALENCNSLGNDQEGSLIGKISMSQPEHDSGKEEGPLSVPKAITLLPGDGSHDSSSQSDECGYPTMKYSSKHVGTPSDDNRDNGDDRVTDHTACTVNDPTSVSESCCPQGRELGTRVVCSKEDILPDLPMVLSDHEDKQEADSGSLPIYPAPVTRVDVIETQPVNQNGSSAVKSSEDTRNVINWSGGERQDHDTFPNNSSIPAIVIDDVSNDGDISDYSDDVDAVTIDAEEYLAFVQNVQVDRQQHALSFSNVESANTQHLLRQRRSRILTDLYRKADQKLSVPANPRLSEERISSRQGVNREILRPQLDFIQCFNSSVALEFAGLRKPLTPSAYNVEFQSYTALRPSSPRPDQPTSAHSRSRQSISRSNNCSKVFTSESTAMSEYTIPRSSTAESYIHEALLSSSHLAGDTMPFLALPQQTEPRRGSLKSAMSSRRSSLCSVGTVHWDLALSDPPELSRQVSWAGTQSRSEVSKGTGCLPNRRHSSAIGVRNERFLTAPNNFVNDVVLAGGLGQDTSLNPRRQSMPTSLDMATRRMSTVSVASAGHSHRTGSETELELDRHGLSRQTSRQYDPKVEKSERFNHQRENAFNKASQWLTPVRRGLQNLQVHYSQINATHNDGLIYAHLLRAAHVKNTVVEEGVYTMERRLYTRRHGKVPHATTFYDTQPSLKARNKDKTPEKLFNTVAKKKKERRERIQRKDNQLKMGYTPRALSLKELGPEDIEALQQECRHLRVAPYLQQHLYSSDGDIWDSFTSVT